MTRIGENPDPDFTREFLTKMPDLVRIEMEILFNTLTPKQQLNALIALEDLDRDLRHVDSIDLTVSAKQMVGIELGSLISIAIPDYLNRFRFWEEYKEFNLKRLRHSRRVSS